MTHFTRRDLIKISAGGVAVASGMVAMPSILRAATYPSRPINVIVPFATGGYNDRLSRAFMPYLEQELGQPLVIVNKPGAGTQLGNSYALNQPADGYHPVHLGRALYSADRAAAERAVQGGRLHHDQPAVA
ncbi:tripartite tricarboxylate transporter substrate-binding protein [Ancylobacter polymorphus]|uniref:tripartite tricarboxylate transporter substrate-binding protein n=1 Tax=Ancylobacter polymorphus TaxID=223390 RepID=UPI002445DA4B|nr:tripartite tricarboxylate transporter substrate-binding protein [Ancylobacter polymorphus]